MLGEGAEELVGHLARGSGDEARSDLGELAADLGVGIVGQDRFAAVLGEAHVGAALGEAGHAALAFALDAVAGGRVDVLELHHALEGRGTARPWP